MNQIVASHLNRALLAAGSDPIDVRVVSAVSKELVARIQSLAELCSNNAKPDVFEMRTVHHLSCTGGTLITKCIASMPNTLVLNEIDLHSPIPKTREKQVVFTPTDIISLLRQGDRDVSAELVSKLLRSNLRIIQVEQDEIGRSLILRDHSHSQFLVGDQVSQHLALVSQLKSDFSLRSLVTVRHPLDSYASMVRTGWHKQFTPSTLEEYCKRYSLFLDAHAGIPVVKYEDFTRAPKTTMRTICNLLALNYYNKFDEVFSSFEFSGDSGRGGTKIKSFKRDSELTADQFDAGEHYIELIHRLEYE